uniref:Uncharacterized protein n=1 Tax=Oryza glumipatula TaxID=40148 RepID=A0A0D9YQ22_9ORYZ
MVMPSPVVAPTLVPVVTLTPLPISLPPSPLLAMAPTRLASPSPLVSTQMLPIVPQKRYSPQPPRAAAAVTARSATLWPDLAGWRLTVGKATATRMASYAEWWGPMAAGMATAGRIWPHRRRIRAPQRQIWCGANSRRWRRRQRGELAAGERVAAATAARSSCDDSGWLAGGNSGWRSRCACQRRRRRDCGDR